MNIPTFDEWFRAQHDCSFDELYATPGQRQDVYLLRLSLATQQYVTYCAQLLADHLTGGR